MTRRLRITVEVTDEADAQTPITVIVGNDITRYQPPIMNVEVIQPETYTELTVRVKGRRSFWDSEVLSKIHPSVTEITNVNETEVWPT